MISAGAKLKHVKTTAVFAPIIDTFEVPDQERLNRLLIDEITHWRAADQGIIRSNVSGWHSDGSIFKRTEPGLVEICKHFVDGCHIPMRRYLPREKISDQPMRAEGWVNINPPHAYNNIHTHNQFDLSGVYFVKVPEPSHEDSGALQFLNPGYRTGPFSELFEKMNPAHFTVRPVEGMMVIFPSPMPHWVLPNDETEDRISIAFNLRYS
jgi:uncharacterized protein (TIGR02466 family)